MKVEKIKSNLFIVGVARAGTSSWHDWLKQHPEIFMSGEQRPNFFGENKDANSRYYTTKERYLSLFKKVRNEKFIGESSHVFGSESAPNQIKEFNPHSKIIIILRSPIEILRSSIDARGYLNVESIVFTFKELLYHDNLKRWMATFGRKNIHVIIFEEFSKDAKKEYKKVCDFLGIDNKFKPEFKKLNYSSEANYSFFMKIFFYIWNKIPFIARLKIKEMVGENKKKIQGYYRKVDNSNEIRTTIPYPDKKLLQKAFFLKEIEKTEKLINRKLDIWKY